LLARVRNIADVPDITQEVYLRMLRVPNVESIRSPEAYLFTVAQPRNGDGQGFAAFAQVVEGMDVVRRIHGLPTSKLGDDYVRGQLLDPPLRIDRATRE